jgi:hypothetical protein
VVEAEVVAPEREALVEVEVVLEAEFEPMAEAIPEASPEAVPENLPELAEARAEAPDYSGLVAVEVRAGARAAHSLAPAVPQAEAARPTADLIALQDPALLATAQLKSSGRLLRSRSVHSPIPHHRSSKPRTLFPRERREE